MITLLFSIYFVIYNNIPLNSNIYLSGFYKQQWYIPAIVELWRSFAILNYYVEEKYLLTDRFNVFHQFFSLENIITYNVSRILYVPHVHQ